MFKHRKVGKYSRCSSCICKPEKGVWPFDVGRKVCHVKEEKQNILEEIVGEGGKKACGEGRAKSLCASLCWPPCSPGTDPTTRVPASTQCPQQLLKDAFGSTDPVVPALQLLQGRFLAWPLHTEAGELGEMFVPGFLGLCRPWVRYVLFLCLH